MNVLLFTLSLGSVSSTACVGLPTPTHNHTHTQGTWSYDAFYGIGGMCGWTDRLETKCFSESQVQRSQLVICASVVLWCEAECMYVFLDACTSALKASLSTSYYVSAAAMQTPLWGFWERAWCVYMVSGVSAVMTNRCVLLLVPAMHCIDGRGVHNHTRPQAFVQISVRAPVSQNHILHHFSALLPLIKGV